VEELICALKCSDLTANTMSFDLCFKVCLFQMVYFFFFYSDIHSQKVSYVLFSKSMSYMKH